MSMTSFRVSIRAALLLGILSVSACAPSPTTLHYVCENGEELRAQYPTSESAVIYYGGERHQLVVAISASGARYVGTTFEWHTKGQGTGSTGLLARLNPSSPHPELVTECRQR